ncbi:MAG: hypothetical protein U1E73_03455 [Planctomycetota bacterium]
MQTRFARILTAILGLGAALAGQRDLASWPADPLRELGRLPVAAAVADGGLVSVRDEQGRGVADADAVVVDLATVDGETIAFLDSQFGTSSRLLLAAAHGTRYRTGGDGDVRVAMPDRGVVVAWAGTDLGAAIPVGRTAVVRLEPRRTIYVEVHDAEGRPAPDVLVCAFAANTKTNSWFAPVVHTDRLGRALLHVRPARKLEVRALLVAGPDPEAEVPADYFDRKPGLLHLALPPVGRVQVRGTFGPRIEVKVTANGRTVAPTRYAADGAWFEHVPLDAELVVVATQPGCTALREVAAGPTKAGEEVVVDVAFDGDAALAVTGRLFDAGGAPVARRKLWACLVHGHGEDRLAGSTTDEAGRFRMTVAMGRVGGDGVQLLLAPEQHLESGDTPVAVAAFASEQRGALDVGDLRLGEEPLLASGRVLEGDRPLAGSHVVVIPLLDGKYEARRSWWHTRTDRDGVFTLRGFDPGSELCVGVDGRDVRSADTKIRFGATGVELRVERPGWLRLDWTEKAPKWLSVEVGDSGGKQDVKIQNNVAKVWPGRFFVELGFLGQRVARFDDIVVQSGAQCDDQRLVALDWRRYVQELTVHLIDAKGEPVVGRVAVASATDATKRWTCDGDERGEVRVPFLEGMRLTGVSNLHRPQAVHRGFEPIVVRLEPRARLRVVVPPDAGLPPGLAVREQEAVLANDVVDGTELRPVGSGKVALEFGVMDPLRGFRALWQQVVEVRDDDLLQVLRLEPDTGGK